MQVELYRAIDKNDGLDSLFWFYPEFAEMATAFNNKRVFKLTKKNCAKYARWIPPAYAFDMLDRERMERPQLLWSGDVPDFNPFELEDQKDEG